MEDVSHQLEAVLGFGLVPPRPAGEPEDGLRVVALARVLAELRRGGEFHVCEVTEPTQATIHVRELFSTVGVHWVGGEGLLGATPVGGSKTVILADARNEAAAARAVGIAADKAWSEHVNGGDLPHRFVLVAFAEEGWQLVELSDLLEREEVRWPLGPVELREFKANEFAVRVLVEDLEPIGH